MAALMLLAKQRNGAWGRGRPRAGRPTKLPDNIVEIGGGLKRDEASSAACSDNHSLVLVCGNGNVASGPRGVKFAAAEAERRNRAMVIWQELALGSETKWPIRKHGDGKFCCCCSSPRDQSSARKPTARTVTPKTHPPAIHLNCTWETDTRRFGRRDTKKPRKNSAPPWRWTRAW